LLEARNRLIAGDMPEARVKSFAPEQVILLDEARACLVRFDDFAKLMVLPAWQRAELAAKSAKALEAPAFFADLVMQISRSLPKVQGRNQQRFALLREVEALRAHAATHHAFPSRLNEVTLPLPLDPFTGKAFSYELIGNTAHIRGMPPSDAKDEPAYRLHYEITLRN
jgi:hypothetical protein